MISRHTLYTLIIALIFSGISTLAASTDNILAVTLMVKNEEQTICATLQPLVDGGVTTFFIYDTYSTDKTVEVARAFFRKHRIKRFKIVQESFVDEAQSLNRALDLTESTFPQTEFIMVHDNNARMVNTRALLEFCVENRASTLHSRGDVVPNVYVMDYRLERLSDAELRARCTQIYSEKDMRHIDRMFEKLQKHLREDLWRDVQFVRVGSNSRYKAPVLAYLEYTGERGMIPQHIYMEKPCSPFHIKWSAQTLKAVEILFGE